MSVRLLTVVLVFMMAQAALFGTGAVIVLATALTGFAMQLMPWAVGFSVILASPLSWLAAPRWRSRLENRCTASAALATG